MQDVSITPLDEEPTYGTATPAAAEAKCSTATLKRYGDRGLIKVLRTVNGTRIYQMEECRRLGAQREARRAV